MLIEDNLIIESKAVEEVNGIHEAQLLTYMRLAGIKTGLLMNFNLTKLKNGIERTFSETFVLLVSFVVFFFCSKICRPTPRVFDKTGADRSLPKRRNQYEFDIA